MAFTFQVAYAANACTVHAQLYDGSIVCILIVEVAYMLYTHAPQRMLISLNSLSKKVAVACRMKTMAVSQIDQKTWSMHSIPFLALQRCL